MNRFLLAIAGLVLIGVAGVSLPQSKEGETATPVKDPFPNGCVSCHITTPEGMDVRLNVLTKNIKGHPNIASFVKVVPTDCMKCHKDGGKIPSMDVVVHKAHFAKGEESIFVEKFNGDCKACHVLDMKTYEMGVKSGAKNW
ncbi:MAG TPA: hypothetical protein VNI20_06305 [Fimbriimonadaceae bacterium]|nr:hypothetical protein [Fimbriimonadaceae bacterium]